MKILVTGGAGFIGSAVVRQAVADGHHVVNLDALTYAACLDNVASVADSPLYAFEQADIRDRAALDAVLCQARPRCGDASGRREPCGPLHRRAGRFHRDQHHRHLQHARGRSRLLGAGGQARGFPLSPHLDRRGLRLAGRRGAVHRGHALRSALALFRLQGGERSPRAGVVSHLRSAGGAEQLLEQLRALSLPRKADPGDHHQRARGQAAADLRRRVERARLALCRGSRHGPC